MDAIGFEGPTTAMRQGTYRATEEPSDLGRCCRGSVLQCLIALLNSRLEGREKNGPFIHPTKVRPQKPARFLVISAASLVSGG